MAIGALNARNPLRPGTITLGSCLSERVWRTVGAAARAHTPKGGGMSAVRAALLSALL
jgi:hypothetical protein